MYTYYKINNIQEKHALSIKLKRIYKIIYYVIELTGFALYKLVLFLVRPRPND